MGEILGIGLTHFPLFKTDERMSSVLHDTLKNPALPEKFREANGWPEKMREEYGSDRGVTGAKKHREACVNELRKLRTTLDDFNPDFVIIWGDDRYENFKEDIIPTFCVGIYDLMSTYRWNGGIENIWGESSDKMFVSKGHQAGGKTLASSLVREGFDLSYAYQLRHSKGMPHAFMDSVLYLDYDRKGFDYPIVPFNVNCHGRRVIVQQGGHRDFVGEPQKEEDFDPPAPTSKRCMELGAATVRALKDSPWRVALIASSSWSHAFLTEKNHFLYPDGQNDKVLYKALVNGDYDTWRNLTTEELEANGQQEILNWSCLVGAMEELGRKSPDTSAFIDTYILNSNKTFATYKGEKR